MSLLRQCTTTVYDERSVPYFSLRVPVPGKSKTFDETGYLYSKLDGKLLIVDCGVLFPDESQPGIDLILPDFSYIRDRLKDVVAVIGVRRESRQVLQSKIPLPIDLRVRQPWREVCAAPRIRRQDLIRGAKRHRGE